MVSDERNVSKIVTICSLKLFPIQKERYPTIGSNFSKFPKTGDFQKKLKTVRVLRGKIYDVLVTVESLFKE